MKTVMKAVAPLAVAIVILAMNQTTGPPTTVKTTQPTQPTTAPTPTQVEPTTTTDPQPTTTTKPAKKKRKRSGDLPKTGPGDEAGTFRLILFNGGFLLIMIGAIFFAVRRRLEHREWWRMSSRNTW